ncbi:MAG: hypothetical protein ACRDQU_12100 [Pseudonocardiaceae bacterium]
MWHPVDYLAMPLGKPVALIVARLEKRAESQRASLEEHRIQVAKKALSS